jgi:hypothetical protein
MSLRTLTVLVALIAAVIVLIATTADLVEFILPVIGAAAVVLLTIAIATMPENDDRQAWRPDETERHHW